MTKNTKKIRDKVDTSRHEIKYSEYWFCYHQFVSEEIDKMLNHWVWKVQFKYNKLRNSRMKIKRMDFTGKHFNWYT